MMTLKILYQKIYRNNETTIDGNVQNYGNAHARFESSSNNDDIDNNGLSPTVMVGSNDETTTVGIAHARSESNLENNDIENNGLSPTVTIDRTER